MKLKYRLLDHPFYQSWNEGSVTKEQLTDYAESYKEIINKIPEWWGKILKDFDTPDSRGVVEDETRHIAQWNVWADKLEKTGKHPRFNDLTSELDAMTASELLGAIHAFEIQQPEVASTKKEGLLWHYGFTPDETIYFDEHMDEAAHIGFGAHLADQHANMDEFEKGFERGSELFYKGLDRFCD